MKSLIYIVLPVYNWEKYLLQQLMSIYFQDYENWHLVIVNDWSTDSTKSIIDKFLSDYDLEGKVTVVSQPNKWLNKSIENWLLEVKKIITSSWINNAYITYCDADDLMMTNRLSYQVNYMETHKDCDLSYHDLVLIDENNSIINTSFLKMIDKKNILINIKNDSFCEFCMANHIPATTIMFRSENIDLLIPFPKAFPFQDRWTSLIFSSNNLNIKNMHIPLWSYRRYSNQMSDMSKKKVDLAKRFGDFKEALQEVAKRTEHKERSSEAMEYVNYYDDRIKRIKNCNNKIIQLIKVMVFHPKIIIRKVFHIKNF